LQITDAELKKALINAIADDQSLRILTYTNSRPRSVIDLVKYCAIPHTTAYRLVNDLKDQGLLVVEKLMLSSDGKKYALYRSTFKSVTVNLCGDKIEVDAAPNLDIKDKAFKLFFSLKG